LKSFSVECFGANGRLTPPSLQGLRTNPIQKVGTTAAPLNAMLAMRGPAASLTSRSPMVAAIFFWVTDAWCRPSFPYYRLPDCGWHHRIWNGPFVFSSAGIGREGNRRRPRPLRGRLRTVRFWRAS